MADSARVSGMEILLWVGFLAALLAPFITSCLAEDRAWRKLAKAREAYWAARRDWQRYEAAETAAFTAAGNSALDSLRERLDPSAWVATYSDGRRMVSHDGGSTWRAAPD
jgi:hypothetical protein